jgi:mono/diheme cytochrome c family protein
MIRMTSTIAFLLFFSPWTVAVSLQANADEATPTQGHAFALLVCAACHVVASDQESPPILRNPGPNFDMIANKPTTTAESLQAFLSTTHAKIGVPGGMPNPRLADYQMSCAIPTIATSRSSASRPV